MTTIATLLERVGLYTQDADHTAWSEGEKRLQLLDTIARLVRQDVCGEIAWHRGLAGQPLIALGSATISVTEIVYDGRSLRRVDDVSLARHDRHWETVSKTPQVYTMLLEAPQTVRLVPAPVLTGSDVPQVPGVPILQQEAHNVLAWTYVNPQDSDEEVFQCAEVFEDIVVYETVAALCAKATEYQDLGKAAAFRALAAMLLSALTAG